MYGKSDIQQTMQAGSYLSSCISSLACHSLELLLSILTLTIDQGYEALVLMLISCLRQVRPTVNLFHLHQCSSMSIRHV